MNVKRKGMVDAEELANRILDTFGSDLGEGTHFDALCQIVEEHLEGDKDPKVLCLQLGRSSLPRDVVVVALLTLLHRPFQEARGRVTVPLPPSEKEVGFMEMSMGSPRPRDVIDLDGLDTRVVIRRPRG